MACCRLTPLRIAVLHAQDALEAAGVSVVAEIATIERKGLAAVVTAGLCSQAVPAANPAARRASVDQRVFAKSGGE